MLPTIRKPDQFKYGFQIVLDKIVPICPDIKWLGFQISDPILNPDHLQPNLFLTIWDPDYPDFRSPLYSDNYCIFKFAHQVSVPQVWSRHPWMQLNLGCGGSVTRLNIQHDLDQIFRLFRDGQPVSGIETKFALADSLKDFVGRVGGAVGERSISG